MSALDALRRGNCARDLKGFGGAPSGAKYGMRRLPRAAPTAVASLTRGDVRMKGDVADVALAETVGGLRDDCSALAEAPRD